MWGYLPYTRKAAGIVYDPEKKLQWYLRGEVRKDKNDNISQYISCAE